MSERAASPADAPARWVWWLAPPLAAGVLWAALGWAGARVEDAGRAAADADTARRIAASMSVPEGPGGRDAEAAAPPPGGTLAQVEAAVDGLGAGAPLITTASGVGGAAAIDLRLEGLSLADTLGLLDRLAAARPPLLTERVTLDPDDDAGPDAWSVSLRLRNARP